MLEQMLGKFRPAFEEGGKLHACESIFSAMDNFFFGPAGRTKVAPFARDAVDIKRFMSMVVVALLLYQLQVN